MKRQPTTPTLFDLGLQPEIAADLPSLLVWLDKASLTRQGRVMDHGLELDLPGADVIGTGFALAQSTSRHQSRPLRSAELKALKERFKDHVPQGLRKDALWGVVGNADTAVRALSWGVSGFLCVRRFEELALG